MSEFDLFERLGLALAVGLLIGLERGWSGRSEAEGGRVAGIRTFGLIGFAGGIAALLFGGWNDVAFALVFAALAALVIAAHLADVRRTGDLGITTSVAALLAFLLGAVAVSGNLAVAAAGAVLTALLLSLKPELHRWLARLEQEELRAVLKLLLISVVLLPVLPDRGFGPWGALNPYEIWWMVVLIAGLSFAGYVATRAVGPERGVMLTGLVGGLTSSTAATASFAKLYRANPKAAGLLAAGAATASAMMLPRLLLIVGIVQPALLVPLAWPFGAAAVASFAAVLLLWRRSARVHTGPALGIANPFEFWAALRFGALLAAIMLLSRAVPAWLGDEGLLLLAAISGAGDVDAITLSMARLTGAELSATIASLAILVAVLANSVVKVAIATIAGGPALGWRLAATFATGALAGGLAFWLAPTLSLPMP